MRYLFTLLLAVILCTSVRAQVGVRVDGEYVEWCMVDVLVPDNVISFTRVLSMTTKEVIDIGTDGSTYLVVGNPQTCEAYQLGQVTADPVGELYDECQCAYTITQENNRVTSIVGGVTQEYTVEFQEVVRRQCGGQEVGVVVHRDTLTSTQAIPATSNASYGFSFTGIGQFVDKVNLRAYATGTQRPVTIDLNPSTVQTTYPGLSLNTADFSYDGSNTAAMATAYALVANEAVENAVGVPVNTIIAISFGATINLRIQLLHDPPEPYITTPRPGDNDYNIVTTIPGGNVAFSSGTAGLITRTNTYTEECSGIFEERSGIYLTWSPDFPRDLTPRLPVTTTQRPSTQTVFCDVDPAVCAATDPSEVAVGGCVSICDTVNVSNVDTLSVEVVSADTLPVQVVAMPIDTCGASTQSHQQFSGTSGTLTADTYASVAITVTSGTVAVTIDGEPVNYPAGFTANWTVTNLCDRLTESFTIDAANGSAIITTLQ